MDELPPPPSEPQYLPASPVTTTLTVTIHATQAGAVHDTWQITKFAGTMSQSASA